MRPIYPPGLMNLTLTVKKLLISVELEAHFLYNICCDLSGIDFIINSFINPKIERGGLNV
jgi:hypothetical protein